MYKEIRFSDDVRKFLKLGIDKVANAVKSTLGPRGRNVVLYKRNDAPTVTNDGVTIAKDISLKDSFEDAGAQLIREASSKTNDVAGDGTTSVCVLAQAMVEEGFRNITAGANPVLLKKGMEMAVNKVVDNLRFSANHIVFDDMERAKREIKQVASISAGDEVIGDLIAEVIVQTGKDGIITVEEGDSGDTKFSMSEGMRLDRGYVSPYFITDPKRDECVLENPLIVIIDRPMALVDDFINLLKLIVGAQRSFLFIADEIIGLMLSTLISNKMRGVIKCAAIKSPGFGLTRKEILEDLAVYTNGKVLSHEAGFYLPKAGLDVLGQAKKVIVTRDKTTIIGGAGSKESIQERIEQIQAGMDNAESGYAKETLNDRISKLQGRVCVIEVGAYTESELKNKKFKVEDALHATRSAVEEGTVVGGGVALLKAADDLSFLAGDDLDNDLKTGIQIVKRALQEPVRVIAENAGADGSTVVQKIIESFKMSVFNFGFNAANGKFENLIEAGVIDPVKVTRTALQNAASIAGLILTSEVLIVECGKKEYEDANN